MTARKRLLMRLWIFLLLALVTAPAAAQSLLRCTIAEKRTCAPHVGCQAAPAALWNIVDVKNQTISRCDSKGCDTYPAVFATSGAFINIGVPQRGYMAKMSINGAFFSEVATQGEVILLSFGSCSPG